MDQGGLGRGLKGVRGGEEKHQNMAKSNRKVPQSLDLHAKDRSKSRRKSPSSW